MKKIFKIFLYVFFGFVLLFLLLFAFVYFNKAYILKNITGQLSETLHASVTAKDLHLTILDEFPRVSLTLVNVEVHDSLYVIYHTSFLNAEKIFFQTDVSELLLKNIKVNSFKIRNASVNVFKTKQGYSNDYIFKGIRKDSVVLTKSESAVDFEIKEVGLQNVKVAMTDSLKDKNFSFHFIKIENHLSRTESIIKINAEGNIYFSQLSFNIRKGSFLENKNAYVNLKFEMNTKKSILEIIPGSLLQIDESSFYMEGNANFSKPKKLSLTINNETVNYDLATTVVTKKIASKLKRFKWKGNFNTSVYINAYMDTFGIQPEIMIKATPDTSINMVFDSLNIERIKFNGIFTNHSDSLFSPGDNNSQIFFEKITASVEGLPVKGKMTVSNFIDPNILATFTSSFNLKDEQDAIDLTKIKLNNGHFNFTINYNGPAVNMYDRQTHKLYAKVSGSLSMTDGDLIYIPRKLRFSKLNTSCSFNQSDFAIYALNYNLNGSNISSKGFIQEFIPFLLIPDAGTFARFEVNCETLYLDKLILPDEQIKQVIKGGKKAKRNVVKIVDDLINNLNVEAKLYSATVKYQKFTGKDAKGLFTIESNKILITDFSINNSGGQCLVDASITENNTQRPLLTVNARVKNAQVNELFTSCNNFGQEKLTDKNLRGVINTNIRFASRLNSDLKLLPETMTGDIDLSIKKGQLNNFEALGDITKYIFSGRDFDSISFQEIKSNIVLQGYDLKFNQLDLASSVMSMRVDGIYSFKKNTDLSIQIPLKNLKKKKEDYQMSVEDLQNYKGANVFLRARTKEDGTVHIGYDPLKKLRKNK